MDMYVDKQMRNNLHKRPQQLSKKIFEKNHCKMQNQNVDFEKFCEKTFVKILDKSLEK